jgi:uncharacterized protein YjiS (DUF1127 family)
MTDHSIPSYPSTPFEHNAQSRWSLSGWLVRWRERESLRNISDDTLRDVGLSRAVVEREIDRLR